MQRHARALGVKRINKVLGSWPQLGCVADQMRPVPAPPLPSHTTPSPPPTTTTTTHNHNPPCGRARPAAPWCGSPSPRPRLPRRRSRLAPRGLPPRPHPAAASAPYERTSRHSWARSGEGTSAHGTGDRRRASCGTGHCRDGGPVAPQGGSGLGKRAMAHSRRRGLRLFPSLPPSLPPAWLQGHQQQQHPAAAQTRSPPSCWCRCRGRVQCSAVYDSMTHLSRAVLRSREVLASRSLDSREARSPRSASSACTTHHPRGRGRGVRMHSVANRCYPHAPGCVPPPNEQPVARAARFVYCVPQRPAAAQPEHSQLLAHLRGSLRRCGRRLRGHWHWVVIRAQRALERPSSHPGRDGPPRVKGCWPAVGAKGPGARVPGGARGVGGGNGSRREGRERGRRG